MNLTIDRKEERQEATNLVSQADFIALKDFFEIDAKKTTHQEDFILMDKKDQIRRLPRGTVLRVRKTKDKKAMLQFKLPQSDGGIIKPFDELDPFQCNELLNHQNLSVQKTVFKALKGLNIGNPLRVIGKMSTIRSRVPFDNKWHEKIILDHVWLTAKKSRCEIRVLAKTRERSRQVLKEICDLHHIPIVDSPPKIEELYTLLGL